MSNTHFFRCKSNPKGPLLELADWEAFEMRTHPDYERINPVTEEVIPFEEHELPHRLPMRAARSK